MTDRSLREALRSLDVPEHRTDFWDGLAERLSGEPPPDTLPVVQPPTVPVRRGFPWLPAAVAGAAVLAVGVVTVAVSGLLGGAERNTVIEEDDTLPDPPPITITVDEPAPDLPEPPDTVDHGGPAPWSGPALPQSEVPAALVEAWNEADNQTWCSALAPSGFDVGDATARRAEFSGGWAVAWDLPDLRSAFGVAGVGLPVFDDVGVRHRNQVTFEDGSVLGWDGEGFDPSNPRLLGEFAIPGQGCAYQVWSELGPDHLISFVRSLRHVDGLQAEPVELRTGVEIVDGGVAPWSAAPIPLDAVPALLAEAWAASGAGAPLLAAADLGPELDGAVVRPAEFAQWGVAWDLPDGPGHDSLNTPCLDCGRGVIGIGGGFGSGEPVGSPVRVEWDDGSFAEIAYRVANPLLPPDRPQFRDAGTGQPVPDGLQATITIPGVGGRYVVWSHLGFEHLLELIDRLRFVES